jgi:tRNA U34 5-carboxymethylaminomethyl modifying GTPase MnmE/TrmE
MKKEKNQIKESIQRQERNQEIRETIVAASTPLGVGAVGIVKLSGRDSIEIASKVCKLRSGKKIQKLPSFKLTLCDIIDDNNKALDEGLVVLMREPYSYTRENVVEIQVHSSTLIIQKIIQICIIKGARLAEPGEFTKRAFLNGRISLNQAESIAEIVKAQSEKALYSLYQNLRGMFGEKISEWQKSLILIQANIQVECDFSDRIGTSDIKNSIIEEINTIRQIELRYNLNEKNLSNNQKRFLVKLIHESIMNACKHSSAKKIQVKVGHFREGVYFVVRDNGKGFILEKALNKKNSFGLKDLYERVKLIGGTLRIQSVVDKGTIVKAVFPIHG